MRPTTLNRPASARFPTLDPDCPWVKMNEFSSARRTTWNKGLSAVQAFGIAAHGPLARLGCRISYPLMPSGVEHGSGRGFSGDNASCPTRRLSRIPPQALSARRTIGRKTVWISAHGPQCLGQDLLGLLFEATAREAIQDVVATLPTAHVAVTNTVDSHDPVAIQKHLNGVLSRLSWKWRERSPVKITERTRP
jgi:hypothetical protein